MKKTKRKVSSARKRTKKDSAKERLLHHLERKYTANFEPIPTVEPPRGKKKNT